MTKRFILASVLMTQFVVAAPRYVTNWIFKATYDSGETMEFTNTSEEEAVIPWVGSMWTCRKESVNYTNKSYVGGFSCRNKQGGFATIYASCSSTKVTLDSNRAAVGDTLDGFHLCLFVRRRRWWFRQREPISVFDRFFLDLNLVFSHFSGTSDLG